MRAAIFAGGLGTRIRGLDANLPKPLIPVGPLPILAHVITIYASNGINDIIVLGGYKVEMIREFLGRHAEGKALPRSGAWQFDGVRFEDASPCSITLLDTGAETDTGGRLFQAKDLLKDARFSLTYGDSLVDFDLRRSLKVLEAEGSLGVLCSYKYPFAYGALSLQDRRVTGFAEKKLDIFLNAGFYVLEPQILDHVTRLNCSFERDVLPSLASRGMLAADREVSFWHPMDTPFDHADLSAIYEKSRPKLPWLRT